MECLSVNARMRVRAGGARILGPAWDCVPLDAAVVPFSIDVLTRPHCGGLRELSAFLTDGLVVRKIVAHLGAPTEPPRLASARASREFESAE